MFGKRYGYHISYLFKSSKGDGIASVDLARTKKIKSFDDLENVSEYIRNFNKFDNVNIICYQRVK